jgi:DNA helicase-2/ATP-dependent DNA helicase PcrA
VRRRNYRSGRPIFEALIAGPFNDPDRLEVKPAISKRLRPVRAAADERPVRLEAFATHGEEADWIAGEIGRRIASGASPRDHAVLVRANSHADPILRSLNVAGIPWRFSGTSGLYARPEVRRLLAFLRAVADPGSSVDVYAVATVEPYLLGGEDLTAIVNMARRRHRSVWDVLEELERQPGILRVSEATRAGVARFVGDLRRYIQLAHERPAGEVLYAYLRDSGAISRLAASESVAAEEELRTSPGSSTSSAASRRSSPTTGPSSSPATSTRSSRPATTRRPRTSTRTPTRSRC